MKVTSSQADIIDEPYVRTADENYITARWCSIHRLHTDFAWSGVHALERNLKAILLYNGYPVVGHGHDIVSLYELIKCFAAGLLPDLLMNPPRLGIAHWFDRTPEELWQECEPPQGSSMLGLIVAPVVRQLNPLDISEEK